MVLVVNDKEYPVSYATNQVDFREDEVMNNFYVSVRPLDTTDATFSELASAFKTRLVVIDDGIMDQNPDIEEVTPCTITLRGESSDLDVTLDGFIPETMNQNYSDNEEEIQIHFRKEIQ